ncbi:glycosyltransferase family 2 protein [Bacillus sp. CGMCC 1.16541]|uniref:glycosyltransferase family 2 protein n=1 Tax=Bacillus sp. CGMCC 1.16541 TaxID=2185143 RepID=UPI000D73DBD3|nr:glycosyltransferase family 2 protein [Bacillus sp. CGMCC 1.16541]
MKRRLSFCMICKNEEKHLPRCLQSVASIADELIVVDTGSTDKTIAIAEQFGALVLHHQWNHDFAEARNIGLCAATGDYVLFLDADEELHPDDQLTLRNVVDTTNDEAIFLKIHNYVGKIETEQNRDISPVLRLFKRHPHIQFEGRVHEQIGFSISRTYENPSYAFTDIRILHYGYLDEVVQEKEKSKRNMTLLKKAVEEDDSNPFHYYNLAGEYIRIHKYEPALHLLRKAKQLCQIETMAFGHLVIKKEVFCLVMLGNVTEAIETCRAEICKFPDYIDLYFLWGKCAILLGHITEAKEVFTKGYVITSVPSYYSIDAANQTAHIPFHLAVLEEHDGNVYKAKQWYEILLLHHPTYPHAFFRYIRLCKTYQLDNWQPFLRNLQIWKENEQTKTFLHMLMLGGHFQFVQSIVKEHQLKEAIPQLFEICINEGSPKEQLFKRRNLSQHFQHFLYTGNFPDQATLSKEDYETLPLLFLLSSADEQAKLLKLWRYNMLLYKDNEHAPQFALHLVQRANYLLKGATDPAICSISYHLPLLIYNE